MTALMHITGIPGAAGTAFDLQIRCPSCRQRGTFDVLSVKDQALQVKEHFNVRVGIRACPDRTCKCLVLFVGQQDGTVLATYPTETLEFDASSIPATVADAMSEAVTCHANQCYTAAGIMVRKTLEELCHDKGATGPNLAKRINALRGTIVLPEALLNGLDDLRLLGNDAAHTEIKTFEAVGKEEVEVSLEFAREVLKAVYQYDSLVARIQALKKHQQSS